MIKAEMLDDSEIRDIYGNDMQRDFRKEEIKPLNKILRLKEKGNYSCIGFYKEDALIGYAFVCYENKESFLLLDYYAVLPSLRNKGYGGKCLSLIKSVFKKSKGIILETEDTDFSENSEDYSIRERRINFYSKNGFIRHNIKSSIFQAKYIIMSLCDGNKLNTDCFIYDEIERIYHIMFDEKQYRENVSVTVCPLVF